VNLDIYHFLSMTALDCMSMACYWKSIYFYINICLDQLVNNVKVHCDKESHSKILLFNVLGSIYYGPCDMISELYIASNRLLFFI